MRSVLPPLLLALFALPACATYQQSLHDMAGGGVGNVSGAADQIGGSAAGGLSGGSTSTTGGQSAAGSGTGGSLGAGAGGAAVSAGAAGASSGTSGSAGSGPTAGAGGTSTGGAPAGGAPAGGAPAGGAPAGGAPAGGAPAGGAPAGGAPAGGGGAGGAVSTVNPCLRASWTATASESSLTMPDLYNPPPYAIDGVAATRWSSGMPPKGGEWFLLDLGAKASHLTKLVLDTTLSTGDFPLAYKLELSVDGITYTQVATGAGADVTTITFADTPARYLKVTQTSTATQVHWWSIHELTITCTP